jgi:putative Mn2+ efflux pump MntP
MFSIITGSIILSLLHATIPNHWLPVIAIGREEKWTLQEVTKVTFISAVAHGLSTVIIGFALGFVGSQLAARVDHFTHFTAPVILIVLGVIFIYRHHKHKHFHIDDDIEKKKSKKSIIIALVLAMFLSPCMEIEAYFLLAGSQAKWLIWFIAALYLIITTVGMVTLVRFAYMGVLKLNWHTLEHNAGIITGVTLVGTGILAFFIH